MKYLRQLVGRQVLVQLEFEGLTLHGILDVAAADHIELVDVTVHGGRGEEPKPADGRFCLPAIGVAWVQIP